MLDKKNFHLLELLITNQLIFNSKKNVRRHYETLLSGILFLKMFGLTYRKPHVSSLISNLTRRLILKWINLNTNTKSNLNTILRLILKWINQLKLLCFDL